MPEAQSPGIRSENYRKLDINGHTDKPGLTPYFEPQFLLKRSESLQYLLEDVLSQIQHKCSSDKGTLYT